MKKSRFNEGQIVFASKQAEPDTKIEDVRRRMGVLQAAFFRRKQLYGGLGPSQLRRPRQLEDGNRKLNALAADLSLDKPMVQDVL